MCSTQRNRPGRVESECRTEAESATVKSERIRIYTEVRIRTRLNESAGHIRVAQSISQIRQDENSTTGLGQCIRTDIQCSRGQAHRRTRCNIEREDTCTTQSTGKRQRSRRCTDGGVGRKGDGSCERARAQNIIDGPVPPRRPDTGD